MVLVVPAHSVKHVSNYLQHHPLLFPHTHTALTPTLHRGLRYKGTGHPDSEDLIRPVAGWSGVCSPP